jgi:membrane-associated phospholipid phosphatase
VSAQDQVNYKKVPATTAWNVGAYATPRGWEGCGKLGLAEKCSAWIIHELTLGWKSCGAFEWVALAYLGLSSALIIIFAANLAHPFRLMAVQTFVALGILFLCRIQSTYSADHAGDDESFSQRFWHFWRHWYPHLFFLFCFEELGHLMRLISPQWQDAKLIAFDQWFTGVNPILWLNQFATPARNDFMQFAYLTYFLYLVVLGGILYFRRDWHAYWSVMTYSAIAYALGYVIAICFPIESPWFSMGNLWHGDLRGGPFTATINFIEYFGRVRGAAFPSEHVAGSVAALLGAWKHRRWLFWIMLPLVSCMCVSTVWGRYHYVADVFGGIVTGTLGYYIGSRIMQLKRALPAKLVVPTAVAGGDSDTPFRTNDQFAIAARPRHACQ